MLILAISIIGPFLRFCDSLLGRLRDDGTEEEEERFCYRHRNMSGLEFGWGSNALPREKLHESPQLTVLK